ncbi:MAG TPA: MATE family efflux transporter [Bacteroidaceae bacterium]|nr:MATE family efflux transporter [Bacteroidaceae bacterium]
MASKKIPSELGDEKIGKLLIRYAVPAIIAMIASSLYNIVDRAFIGQGVDALALSGLAITFPFMNLSAALGSMVGIGSSTMISLKMGQKDYENAQTILGNSIVLNLIIGLSFSALSIIFIDPILYVFGATNATIGYAKGYMIIILMGNIITHTYFGLNAILRATGHPRKAMFATISTVIMNIILDYIFIMKFGWGVKGAAFATILSQIIALSWQIYQFTDKNELIRFKHGIYKLKKNLVKNILSIGLSPGLMNSAACVVALLINRGLLNYSGDLAIGAYGIINSISFLFLMIVMGLNQSMQPIAGYNYGAKQYKRVLEVLKKTIILATFVTTLGFVIGQFASEICIKIFTSDPELTAIAKKGMSIVFMVFPLIGFMMVTGNFFQSIGKPIKSIFLSMSRQVLFLIPCLIILPKFFGIDGVWYSLPLSDAISVIVAAAMLFNQVKKIQKLAINN